MVKKDKGKFGEKLAKGFLTEKGYKIIKENFRTKFGEIDLIAEKDNQIIFIEVKYRTNPQFGKAEDTINPIKLKKIYNTAQIFLNCYKTNIKNFRIDIIAINNFDKLEINHYQNIILEDI